MEFRQRIVLGGREISRTSPVFIIAEAGVNHNGDLDRALRMIDEAAGAGVDAVKFQSFHCDDLLLPNIDKAPYQKQAGGEPQSQFEMLSKLRLSLEQHEVLKDRCRQRNVLYLTTPFDERSLDEIDKLNVSAYKVASTDTTNLPFLKKVASRNKPILLSTGMSYLEEIASALKVVSAVNKDVVLLQCTANYPIRDEEVNLRVLRSFADTFDILVGFSDHSTGVGAGPCAVSLGASVIEKHFTLDRSLPGPDHQASLSVEDLYSFVREIRRAETFMGSRVKMPIACEIATRKALQKCLVTRRPVVKGEAFSEVNITAKRTGGHGVSPVYCDDVIGRKADRNYSANEVIELP